MLWGRSPAPEGLQGFGKVLGLLVTNAEGMGTVCEVLGGKHPLLLQKAQDSTSAVWQLHHLLSAANETSPPSLSLLINMKSLIRAKHTWAVRSLG